MLLIVTPDGLRRAESLRLRASPAPLLRHGLAIAPRGGPFGAVWWRLLFEHSLPRYLLALSPFPVAMFVWPDLALPISQAPLLMIGVVLFIESNVLSISSPERRRELIDRDSAARGLDLFAVRGREILTRIAAGRGLASGTLHLVVEQSPMARGAPLTLVSVQVEGDPARLLDLDPDERALVTTLFAEGFSARDLRRINLADNRFLRSVALDARSVSAHARLAALAG